MIGIMFASSELLFASINSATLLHGSLGFNVLERGASSQETLLNAIGWPIDSCVSTENIEDHG